jgi:uncharacterized protein
MDVRGISDPAEFRERAMPLFMADEARHSVMLAVSRQLVEDPSVYESFRLWLVEDGGDPVVAAHLTRPFHVAVCAPSPAAAPGAGVEAIEALTRAIRDDGVSAGGVFGGVPEADEFARSWSALSGDVATAFMKQGIYKLTAVIPVADPPPGSMRPATGSDRALLVDWIAAFEAEALHDPDDPVRTERYVDRRFTSPDPGLFLWEDAGPVCLVGAGGLTPNGIRIGPVYTPPDLRGRGYATALTAAVSQLQLDRGRTFCFLHTDLANPTSNDIYRHVGYEHVCDAVDYRFEARAG